MIVTCSACKTRYLTDPAALGHGGRMVRCAKCGHTWMQTPPADLPHRVDVFSPALGAGEFGPPKFNVPAPYVPPPRRRRGVRAAMLAAAVVVALVGGGYLAQSQIIAAWPEAQRVYDLIGDFVGASTSTLDVGEVRVVRQPVGGVDMIVLLGEITNRGDQPQAVPLLRITLFDANDVGVMDWIFSASQAVLQPGETGRFRTEAMNPPMRFDRTAVTIVDGGG